MKKCFTFVKGVHLQPKNTRHPELVSGSINANQVDRSRVKHGMTIGFTLAEVLITLGIIGVVAALTMPSLIAKHQKQVWVNQLRKHVSVMQQGFNRMLADDGVDFMHDTRLGQLIADTSSQNSCMCELKDPLCTKVKNKLQEYFKIEPINSQSQIKYLSGNQNYSLAWNWVFSDGSLLSIDEVLFEEPMSNTECEIWKKDNNAIACTGAFSYYIDVNGVKGPNQLGRDIFYFAVDNKGRVLPYSSAFGDWHNDSDCGESGGPIEGVAVGEDCSARIMENGWVMDY